MSEPTTGRQELERQVPPKQESPGQESGEEAARGRAVGSPLAGDRRDVEELEDIAPEREARVPPTNSYG